MAYDVMLSQTPQALRTPVVWRLPGCGGGKTALFCGAAQTLGAELQALGARHIFLVIGRHAARTDTKAVILNSLRASGITWDVYSEIPAEPHLEDALQMAEAMKGARYDAVVGVGGGSVLDLAKLAAHNVDGALCSRVRAAVFSGPRLPLVLLPTTSGTGSEVSPYAVVTVDGKKVFYTSENLLPNAALIDPLLTVSMPPRTTAATALDALTHALEGAMGRPVPFTSAIAAETLRLILDALPRALENGEDVQARYDLSFASVMAMMGYAIGGGLYAHSVSYILTLEKGAAHGVGGGLALPFTMKLNETYIRPFVSRLESVCSGSSPAAQIRRLYLESGLPENLQAFGYREEEIPRLAELLLTKYGRKTNPRTYTDADAQRLFAAMYHGNLEEL